MPEFAVEMLRVITLDALPAAEAHVHRPPGSEEGGQCSHVGSWGAAAAEAHGQPRIPGFIEQSAGARNAPTYDPIQDMLERAQPNNNKKKQ